MTDELELPASAPRPGTAASEVRGLRNELQLYIGRHDREHEDLKRQLASHRIEQKAEHAELLVDVAANTSYRVERQAYERIIRYLIGTNVGVAVAVAILIIEIASGG